MPRDWAAEEEGRHVGNAGWLSGIWQKPSNVGIEQDNQTNLMPSPMSQRHWNRIISTPTK